MDRTGKQAYDDLYYRERQKRHVCRTNLSGFPADVIGSYHLGQYGLVARWEAEWGGEDRGKWLLATIMSFSVDKAIELRAVLHTIQPITGQ